MDFQIIAVYCLCADLLKAMEQRDDSQCQMTEAEVMTVGIVAALFFGGNYSLSRLFLKEQGYIPGMLGKSRFSRRIHRVKPMFLTLFSVMGETWKELNEESIYAIDTFPIAVCDNLRIPRCRLYQDESYRGYIASKRRYFYGLKVHILVTKDGQPVEFFLTPGSMADVSGLQYFDFDLPEGATIYADRAYNDYELEDVLNIAGLHFQPMRKKNLKRQFEPYIQFLQHHHRKRVETSISQTEQRFPKTIHATSSEGFELKVVLLILAFSFRCADEQVAT